MVLLRSDGSFRPARVIAAVTAGVLTVGLLSACSRGGPTAEIPDRPVSRAGLAAVAAVEPEASASPDPSASASPDASPGVSADPSASPSASATDGSSEGSTAGGVPATSSGPLTEADLPEGAVLGNKWETYVEPGGNGFVGNGSFAQAREVEDAVLGLTPIGCPEAALEFSLPLPEYALEGSYRGPYTSPGASLLMEFGNDEDSKEFLDTFGQQIDACPPGERDPDGPLVLDFQRLAMRSNRIAAVRQEHGRGADMNRYLIVAAREGNRVCILFLGNTKTPDRDRIGRRLGNDIKR